MSIRAPTAAHSAALADLKEVLAKHAHLTAPELLALAAQMVGNLVALQDQRTMTPDRAMRIVAANIEEGNRVVLAGLHDTKGSA